MKLKLPLAIGDAPPSRWRIWWIAARPRTLALSATPVLVGSALAWAEGASPRLGIALATLTAALLIQIGTNLLNDASDFERGNDRPGRLGPLRVTAAGWASAASVRRAALLAFAFAFALGVFLAVSGGWPIVIIGLSSLAAGAMYSAGPKPISHTPFGELFVWLFFGVFAVSGSHWLQAERLSPAALLAGAALGLPAAAVLLVNNLRDLAADTAAGRMTLAAVLGEAPARDTHAVLMIAPFFVLPLLSALLPSRHGLWLALAALPAAFEVVRAMRRAHGVALNDVLARSARAQFLFGLFLALGCLLPL
ncbi:1,4-dihydroxy-2-naphthoate octaprenyltransferase [Sulfuricystis multivorans]|uniref:1,4-dihydroxy-2-naphthoate octaprenyltransferase n=1 Tax=Sulfuricystis multivorans TaxID=2211108 RepID=UPI000F843524|nr:1,4-dihydroxy-2-naphthoate octaprenyltransferase [Sulfuricystis multivorans]